MEIHPELLHKHGIQKDDVSNLIKEKLKNLSSNNSILSDILNVISIQSRKDPFSSIHLLPDDGKNIILDNKQYGIYEANLEKITVRGDFIENISYLNGGLLHECTHQLMNILYGKVNKPNLNPYFIQDKGRKIAFEKAVAQVLNNIQKADENELKKYFLSFFNNYYHALEIIRGTHNYFRDQYHTEYIARFIEIIARGYYNDPAIKELLQPFMEYWQKYISPDINSYISKKTSQNKPLPKGYRVWIYVKNMSFIKLQDNF